MIKNIVLIGHPNVGKSSLFNTWTGQNTATGNRPGVTVQRRVAKITNKTTSLGIEDLPGIYYLESDLSICAHDQKETLERLLNLTEDDLIVQILDARALRPQLHLTLELIELQHPMCLIVTFHENPEIITFLHDLLKLPVYSATDCNPFKFDITSQPNLVHLEAQPELKKLFMNYSEKGSVLFNRLALTVEKMQRNQESEQKYTAYHDPETLCAKIRYQFIDTALKRQPTQSSIERIHSRGLDKIVLHRFIGLPLFFGIMYCIFWSTMTLGEQITLSLRPLLTVLESRIWHNLPSGIQSVQIYHILWQGSVLSLETILSFIGPVGLLYFQLNILEETGYMQRASLVIDRFMRTLKLPGQSFVSMVVGLGCNVPAILSTRTLSHPIDRLQSILMTPFMSCGARLAIFTAFGQSFFGDYAYLAIFELYMIGFFMAIITGLMVRMLTNSHEHSPLIEQLVPYQRPSLIHLLSKTGIRLQDFLSNAFFWIAPAIIGIHLITTFGALNCPPQFQEWLVFIFRPLGLDSQNWPAVLALFSGLIGKEVLLGTLEGFYPDSSEIGLNSALHHCFPNPQAAMSYLIFVLLYFPCISVTLAIAKETRLFWAIFSAIWSTLIAYITAVLYYQWMKPDTSLFLLINLTIGSICLLWLFLQGSKKIIDYYHMLDRKERKNIPFHITNRNQ